MYEFVDGYELPEQGFKIHISTLFEYADKTLEAVSVYLKQNRIPYKYIKKKMDLHYSLSKDGNRILAGKFITVYPKQNDFLQTIYELHNCLKSIPKGPYVLTDRQYKDSNIYYRYGSFTSKYLRTPSGELILDERLPYYFLPDFVEELIEEEEQEVVEEVTPLEDYKILEAVKFSNGGGNYKAEKNGKIYFIKEARYGLGLDGSNRTAIERLRIEFEALKKLEMIPEVVNPIEFFKVWESEFLVEEFVEGITLGQWIKKNFPSRNTQNSIEYSRKVRVIIDKLINAVISIHSLGIAICDLHPDNILINDNLELKLVDFETATNVDVHDFKPVLRAKNFSTEEGKTPIEYDLYAFKRIFHSMVLHISEYEVNTKHRKWIYDTYGKGFSSYFEKLQGLEEIEFWEHPTNDQTISSLLGLVYSIDVLDLTDFSLLTGAFSVIFSIFKIKGEIPNILSNWILENIDKFLKLENSGLLTGKAGIACTIYLVGFKKEAIQVLDSILLDKTSDDLSLFSGLSGIGLAFLLFFEREGELEYLNIAIEIADILISKKLKVDGLFYGKSGISLFLTHLSSLLKDSNYAEYARNLLENDLNACTIEDDCMYLKDEKTYKSSPYLNDGSLGIAIAIYYLRSTTCQNYFEEEFRSLRNLTEIRICGSPKLYGGIADFFVAESIFNSKQKEFLFEKLNVYTPDKEQSAGILVGISCFKEKNPLGWLPLL